MNNRDVLRRVKSEVFNSDTMSMGPTMFMYLSSIIRKGFEKEVMIEEIEDLKNDLIRILDNVKSIVDEE